MMLEQTKVLIVDDSIDNQYILKIFLSHLKAIPDVAHNGKEAVDKATQSSYDLILMDIMMPVMDGLEACKEIRKHGVDTPIILVTGSADAQDTNNSEGLFNDVLAKPVNLPELLKKIQVIQKRAS